jgi:hypothetical protein
LESAVKHLPIDVPITVIEDPSEEADLEKLVNEFLDGFDDNGPLKTAFLKNYKTKLDKTHWTLYLKNLFEAIGKLSNKPSVLNTTRKKGGSQTKSKRTTRKIRR